MNNKIKYNKLTNFTIPKSKKEHNNFKIGDKVTVRGSSTTGIIVSILKYMGLIKIEITDSAKFPIGYIKCFPKTHLIKL